MSRSRDDLRGRLRQAALELYRERGYDRTTTAEIAARAGVTERTYFRHFPDKREVLFDGEAEFLAVLTASITEAPSSQGPMEVLRLAFRSVEPMIETNRAFNGPAQEVIARTPALQERALAKAALVTSTTAAALQARGVDRNLARLAAGAGMAAFGHAATAWRADPSVGLGAHVERAFEALREISATGPSPSR